MQLTQPQLVTLKNNINAETDPAFVSFRNAGSTQSMADWYNVALTFIIFKPTESTLAIGDVVNFVAVAALTTANIEKLNLFYTLNPSTFEPSHADQRTYMADVFSGALGGQGQATRDALDALYRRAALRGERIYCTGTGTTAVPGTPGPEGQMTNQNITDALAS
jgi:hypothetical protein